MKVYKLTINKLSDSKHIQCMDMGACALYMHIGWKGGH